MHPSELKIRLYGDPCLIQKSAPVKDVGPGERILIEAMFKTMYAHKGIGLAAPQVGINKQIFVADVGDGPIAIINPQIMEQNGSWVMEEGCLSIPGVSIPIERAKNIVIEYINEDNMIVKQEFSELQARVVLHENDHLNGKLILDYIDDQGEKNKYIDQYKKALETGKL